MLSEMTRIGLPIPSGFCITSETCTDVFKYHSIHTTPKSTMTSNPLSRFPQYFQESLLKAVHRLEIASGHSFGSGNFPDVGLGQSLLNSIGRTVGIKSDRKCSPNYPLLLSVRSSPSTSMSGILDSILNIGMNDVVCHLLIEASNDPIFAYDEYCKFIQAFGTTVFNVDEQVYIKAKQDIEGRTGPKGMDIDDIKSLLVVLKELTPPIPEDPLQQLAMALVAVANSWNSQRAVKYREIHNLSNTFCMALLVEQMVFGNLGCNSGAGVCYSRNPCNGNAELVGEYFINSTGTDICSGHKTGVDLEYLQIQLPSCNEILSRISKQLELKFREVQCVEFVIENAKLFVLQCKPAHCSPKANIRCSVAMVEEHLITEREAIMRIEAFQLNYFKRPILNQETGVVDLCYKFSN